MCRAATKENKETAMAKGSLIEKVSLACKRLARHGWAELLRQHGLNIQAAELASELALELPNIDRSLDGFQDFAAEGKRGIEPRRPGLSLLFHAFASPQVTTGVGGKPLGSFPTPAEIEAVENYTYGVEPPSIQDLRVSADDAPLAIVVFACEYRPAINTVHQKHAEMCFSRVGVARIGTEEAAYLPEARGHEPFVAGDDRGIRVIPCRYSAYIAAQFSGDRNGFGPMRFRESSQIAKDIDGTIRTIRYDGDESRNFWVPLHKLFDGPECLRDINLTIKLSAHHVNQKLRRIHQVLASQGHDTGWHEPSISDPPFIITDGLAELSSAPDDGAGLLIPVVHPTLVAEAEYPPGKTLTFKVPRNSKTFSSSLNIIARANGARSAPEYVHARHKVNDDGSMENLNKLVDVKAIVQAGGYRAKHYVDFTAEGWIQAECEAVALQIPRTIPAYSLVAPPDFFPDVKQQDLMQWWKQSAPPDLEDSIWPANPGPPQTLCDIRAAANFTLESANFDESDNTVSAIVAFRFSGHDRPTRVDLPKSSRAVTLPDGAAGVFAPGWDCSIDRTDERDPSDDGTLVLPGVTHLAGYGLGSPFPEDAKLCAALSSFWPAAAPDVTRTFEPGKYATATPLPDDIIGQNGATPWDGIRGPRISTKYKNEVEYNTLDYGDYVESALGKLFSIGAIARTSAKDYLSRTLVMARVYDSLGAKTVEKKREWPVYSFTQIKPADDDLKEAEAKTGKRINPDDGYRFEVFHYKSTRVDPDDFTKALVAFDEMILVFADPKTVLTRKSDHTWEAKNY
jgi:hypothetical protein